MPFRRGTGRSEGVQCHFVVGDGSGGGGVDTDTTGVADVVAEVQAMVDGVLVRKMNE